MMYARTSNQEGRAMMEVEVEDSDDGDVGGAARACSLGDVPFELVGEVASASWLAEA